MTNTPEKELERLDLGDLFVCLPLNMADSCDSDSVTVVEGGEPREGAEQSGERDRVEENMGLAGDGVEVFGPDGGGHGDSGPEDCLDCEGPPFYVEESCDLDNEGQAEGDEPREDGEQSGERDRAEENMGLAGDGVEDFGPDGGGHGDSGPEDCSDCEGPLFYLEESYDSDSVTVVEGGEPREDGEQSGERDRVEENMGLAGDGVEVFGPDDDPCEGPGDAGPGYCSDCEGPPFYVEEPWDWDNEGQAEGGEPREDAEQSGERDRVEENMGLAGDGVEDFGPDGEGHDDSGPEDCSDCEGPPFYVEEPWDWDNEGQAEGGGPRENGEQSGERDGVQLFGPDGAQCECKQNAYHPDKCWDYEGAPSYEKEVYDPNNQNPDRNDSGEYSAGDINANASAHTEPADQGMQDIGPDAAECAEAGILAMLPLLVTLPWNPEPFYPENANQAAGGEYYEYADQYSDQEVESITDEQASVLSDSDAPEHLADGGVQQEAAPDDAQNLAQEDGKEDCAGAVGDAEPQPGWKDRNDIPAPIPTTSRLLPPLPPLGKVPEFYLDSDCSGGVSEDSSEDNDD
ncbi:uncharacterized protein LOC118504353 [Anopheles stephensi]|uniref:uncharacterized protein LOC118504353 n=1 Tax=Anopheles stephensi TaxID=30069 RepID=UPI001658B484|nr:uncharacterized protein LOC118504353 [Anopheles stephensi]